VSFGSQQASTIWLSKYGYQLDIYVDTDRVLYKMLGQGRRCWANIDTIKYATVMDIQGRDMPALIDGDDQDDLQMGGNITIRCSNSQIIMAYPQRGVTDRPSVGRILQKLCD